MEQITIKPKKTVKNRKFQEFIKTLDYGLCTKICWLNDMKLFQVAVFSPPSYLKGFFHHILPFPSSSRSTIFSLKYSTCKDFVKKYINNYT